jgi:hypothetical protein
MAAYEAEHAAARAALIRLQQALAAVGFVAEDYPDLGIGVDAAGKPGVKIGVISPDVVNRSCDIVERDFRDHDSDGDR